MTKTKYVALQIMRARPREKETTKYKYCSCHCWILRQKVNNITRVPKLYRRHIDRMIFPTGGRCLAYPEGLYSPPPHARSSTGVVKNAHCSLPSEQLRLELRGQSEWWSNQLGLHTLVSLILFKPRDTLYC